MARSDCIWTTAWSTSDLTAEQRIAVVTLNTPIAVVSAGEVCALNTFAGLRIASRSMTIAVARLAIREVPVSDLTLVALSSVCLRVTITLSGNEIAFVVFRADAVTIASLTSVGREAVSAWRALFALTSDNVQLTFAVSTMLLTLLAERAGWVAIAG